MTFFVRFGEADTANQFQEKFQKAQSEEMLEEILKSETQQNEGMKYVNSNSFEEQSTWKGSSWSLKSFSEGPHSSWKSVMEDGEKQSTWKRSRLSLQSFSKEPLRFKHVMFDQKAELFNDVKGKWEKLGSGNLTISVDEKKEAELEVFIDGYNQIIRHLVRRETQLVPARGNARAYVWTTEAHPQGEKKGKKMTLLVRFGEADKANQFQEEFKNAQSEEKIEEILKSETQQYEDLEENATEGMGMIEK